MRSDSSKSGPGPGKARRFATTHWSLVLAAAQRASPASRQALATLCESYWYPLYAHVRRRGNRPDEAQDLIQEFFTQLLEKDHLRVVDPQRGRFRSFLLAALDHFLAKERRRAHAQKRGGKHVVISLDFQAGENRYLAEPAHEATPGQVYERRWAMTLIDQVLSRLRDEFARGGKLDLFEHLKVYLGGNDDTVPYREVATALELSEGAVKVAVHRLRRRCRELLREVIAQTVAGPEQVEEEIRDLFHVFSG